MKTILSIPLLLAALAASAETLIWQPSPSATHYTVYKVVAGSNSNIGQTVTNGFNLGPLPVGVHTYTVRAWNQWGASPFSLPASTNNAAAMPPGDVTLASGAILTWTHEGGALLYRVIVLSPGSTNWTLLTTTTVNTLKLDLPPAPYQFRVSASNQWDEAWSESYQAPPAAVAPVNVRMLPR